MYRLYSKVLKNNHVLKCLALVFGYYLWLLLAQNQHVTRTFTVPLCFYNTRDTLIKKAPETIIVELVGKRSVLHALDTAALAAHINTQELVPGKQALSLTQEHLLLPVTVSVKSTQPANIVIELERTHA